MENEAPLVPVHGRGTVSFTRKVQVRDYESAEAFMSVQFDFDPIAQIESDESLLTRAKGAFYEAKAIVFDELGIEFDVVQGRIVEKIVEKTFGTTTEVKSDGPRERVETTGNDNPSCPECNGQMWDNREKKKSGQFSAKAPDFKCRDKSCNGCVWPPKGAK